MTQEKIIYDVGECSNGRTCPKFVIDGQKSTVSLIDKQGNRANMTVTEFNTFIKAVKRNAITEV